jgi:hypothetical protein
MADDKPNRAHRGSYFTHGASTVHQSRRAPLALAMRRKIEQHGAKTATAHVVGKDTHKGGFSRPSMHQKHACGGAYCGLENIRLDVTDAGRKTSHVRRAQMMTCTLYKPIMVRTAVARKTRSAEPAECASPGDLGESDTDDSARTERLERQFP